MRKRNFRIKFRLDEKEAEQLNARVAQSGLPRSGSIRQILDRIPKADALPPAYYAAMSEKLRPIGESFNKIAQKAHVLNVIDRQQYNETFAAFITIIEELLHDVKLARNFGRDKEQERGHTQDA